MPYEFLENVAVADIAFKAWGKDLEEMFLAAADAVMNVMAEDLAAIQPREQRTLTPENEAPDMLLFNFLQEFIYYKDAENLLLRVKQVRIAEKDAQYALSASAVGEELDPTRHHTRVDVKAVTLHRFSVKKTDQGWEASVILDI
ncbi:MAG TPA: archease [Candidatus Binatia bacterium]|jgi:SHS2 domain-containing protein|nr:archease [Candidatus Binatia bacterium]